MRKIYKTDKHPPKPKREKKPAPPPPVIVPVDPDEWPEQDPPAQEADD